MTIAVSNTSTTKMGTLILTIRIRVVTITSGGCLKDTPDIFGSLTMDMGPCITIHGTDTTSGLRGINPTTVGDTTCTIVPISIMDINTRTVGTAITATMAGIIKAMASMDMDTINIKAINIIMAGIMTIGRVDATVTVTIQKESAGRITVITPIMTIIRRRSIAEMTAHHNVGDMRIMTTMTSQKTVARSGIVAEEERNTRTRVRILG